MSPNFFPKPVALAQCIFALTLSKQSIPKELIDWLANEILDHEVVRLALVLKQGRGEVLPHALRLSQLLLDPSALHDSSASGTGWQISG